MIAVVEGLSAAGKTTWCKDNFPDVTVWESPVPSDAPNRSHEPAVAAEYWASRNADRWADAISTESIHDITVCDTDPFKLHYAYSLWQIGEQSEKDWKLEVAVHRELFRKRRIGFADHYFVSVPDMATLSAQKQNDKSRTRSSFDLHSKLGPYLEAWYQAVDSLEPGRVTWEFPKSLGIDDMKSIPRRHTRTDLDLFDRLIAAL